MDELKLEVQADWEWWVGLLVLGGDTDVLLVGELEFEAETGDEEKLLAGVQQSLELW